MRLLQGMLVAHYQGTGKSNALEVFCIPETEHDSFFKWLKEYDATMFRKMKHTSGFVPLGNRKTLTTLTTQYRLSHTQTNVGWKTVPMQPNSVVFWVGPHRVRHARGKTDTDSYRSVLYLNIQDTPLCDELPSTPYDECFANHTQGKQVNRSLETALKDYMAKYGQLYGWNKQTIPSAFHNLFEAPFGETNHTKRDQQHEDTPIADPCTEHPHLMHLRENGYVVIPNALPACTALQLHTVITECVRTVLFRIPRKGMSVDVQTGVLEWSTETFAKRLNTIELNKARYFKRHSTELFCAYTKDEKDETADDSRKRIPLQGVQGITLSSQMLDIYSHPFFAQCLIQIHPLVQRALGTRTFYFGKERCSIRSHGSASLETHIDTPVHKICL